MKRLFVMLLVLLAFTSGARADIAQPTPSVLSCAESTSSVCNDSQVPNSAVATEALDYLYFRSTIISSWRLVDSPGTTDPRFIAADGTATANDFMSGITMPAPGVASLLRVNQTGGSAALEYVLQVNGVDTDLDLVYDEFSSSFNSDVTGFAPWEAGDVLTLKVIDSTVGTTVKTYVTLSGYFL